MALRPRDRKAEDGANFAARSSGRGGGRSRPGRPDEPSRGRSAERPGQIPARGWKDIGWRVWTEFGNDRIQLVAAGVTFYLLLALFPAIAAFISLYGLVADPATVSQQVQNLSGVLPGGAVDVIGGQITRIAAQGGGALGFGFAFGLLFSLWSATSGVVSIFDALNIVYDEREQRSFVRLRLQALAFTLGGFLFMALALGGIVVAPAVLAFLGLGGTAETLLSLLRWPILLLIVLGVLAVLYRYGPSREKAQWRWVTWGSGIAGLGWLAFSMLFSWYVANFGSYNETYGSLGAVIGFLSWIWLSVAIVLLGAEVNAEMEHQTARDTTGAPEQPMGDRGARMADEVGEARN